MCNGECWDAWAGAGRDSDSLPSLLIGGISKILRDCWLLRAIRHSQSREQAMVYLPSLY